MNRWIKTSSGKTETFVNTAAIISIEYHKEESYLRLELTDGKTIMWRASTEDDKIEIERFYQQFLQDISQPKN